MVTDRQLAFLRRCETEVIVQLPLHIGRNLHLEIRMMIDGGYLYSEEVDRHVEVQLTDAGKGVLREEAERVLV